MILVPLLASGWLFQRSLNPGWRMKHLDPSIRVRAFSFFTRVSLIVLISSGVILYLFRYLNPEVSSTYFIRARPVLIYLIILAVQLSLWLILIRNGFHPEALKSQRGIIRPFFAACGVFLLMWLIVAYTGAGIVKDTSYWGEPGIPILGWQLGLSILFGAGLFVYSLQPNTSRVMEIGIPIAIWLLAVILWMSVPMETLRNSFYAPIQPPYSQPFPASDAAYYDSDAQSLILGYGFVHPIPTRPMLILFLAGLHALLGQDYASLVLAQTLIFAFLPVVLYILGRKFSHPAGGVMAALFAIFREWTNLWVASEARVSNTKMLLSEFITTLVLIVYMLLLVRWFREKRGGWYLAFASGGVLGLQLLLRTQATFLIPGILLLALLTFLPDMKRWLGQSFIFMTGLLIAIAPWLIRNYMVTGQLSLDDPVQIKAVASMYSGGTPTSNYPLFEGQTPEQMSQYVVNVIVQKPGYVAGFVANQFFANSIDTLLVLPIFARYDGLSAPIYPYWGEWSTYLSPANIILFTIYLGVIALGVAAGWKRLRWASLIPIVFFIFYNFSTSLARYSGWRYIFPVDWVGYFYFALGVAEGFSMLAVLFGAKPERVFDTELPQLESTPKSGWKFVCLAAVLIFFGSLPWIAESTIPKPTPICADPIPECFPVQGIEEADVERFLSRPNARLLSGTVLYPRYFSRGKGLASTNPTPAYAPRDFPRMGFLFLLQAGDIEQVILPMKGVQPFPNAREALILGCVRDTYIEARFILIPDTGETFSNMTLAEACPTP